MRVQIHIKHQIVRIEVPRNQRVRWILEAALLWYDAVMNCKMMHAECTVKKGNGQKLNNYDIAESVIKEGEAIYVLLPEDIAYLNMGKQSN